MILFLSFSLYQLSGEDLSIFDPKICTQHLNECFLKVLCCYNSLDQNENSKSYSWNNRVFIESLYIAMNIGDSHSLNRSLRLSEKIRKTIYFQSAFQISLAFFTSNFFQCIKIMQTLPHLIAAISSLKLPAIRQQILKNFSTAYSSKVLLVPFDWLQKLLIYDDENLLEADLKLYKLEYIYDKNEKFVKFNKSSFDNAVAHVSNIYVLFKFMSFVLKLRGILNFVMKFVYCRNRCYNRNL